jgi:hypothetical protein
MVFQSLHICSQVSANSHVSNPVKSHAQTIIKMMTSQRSPIESLGSLQAQVGVNMMMGNLRKGCNNRRLRWWRIFNFATSWQLRTQGNVSIHLLQMYIKSSSKGDCCSKITHGSKNGWGTQKDYLILYSLDPFT